MMHGMFYFILFLRRVVLWPSAAEKSPVDENTVPLNLTFLKSISHANDAGDDLDLLARWAFLSGFLGHSILYYLGEKAHHSSAIS